MLRAGMKRNGSRRASALAACALAACAFVWSESAHAQTAAPTDLSRVLELINQQEARLNEQERVLHQQQTQLAEQRALIDRQRREIEAMSGVVSDEALAEVRGAGVPNSGFGFRSIDPDAPITVNQRLPRRFQQARAGGSTINASADAQNEANASGPVGEAPPERAPASVEALPEGQNALLGRGKLTIEPSLEYSRSSSNRLVFRGVEIVTGVQIGLIEANDTARDTVVSSLALRYALTDRLEIEGRVPYIYRSDRITTLSQNNNQMTQTFELDGGDVGDIEVSARYQLNQPERGGAIFVAGARVKSDTGHGPFDIARDASGVSTELATGSGFWGVQGSISALYPTDPVVLFANASYLYNVPRDIDRTVGQVDIGRVDPGDSIGLGFGFGFSLNPRFSFSLGYSHSYVMETTSELGPTTQTSTELQVGSLQFGMSLRASERMTIATSVDIGATEDAPDARIGIRVPYRF